MPKKGFLKEKFNVAWNQQFVFAIKLAAKYSRQKHKLFPVYAVNSF